MAKIYFVLGIVLTLVAMFEAPALAQEVLTNESVLKMVKAGLPESIIIAKVRSAKTNFDLRTDALIALKAAGVPEKVMETMLARASIVTEPPTMTPPPGPTPAPPPVAVPPPVIVAPYPAPLPGHVPVPVPQVGRERSSVYRVVGDKYDELGASVGEVQTSRSFIDYKVEFVLGGRQSGYRVTERQPVFLTSYSPSEAPLVRLKPGENDRNLKIGSGTSIPWGGQQRRGVRAEDRIDVQSERDSRGFYRISPRQPLAPGEYGFVLTQDLAGSATGKIYDFGID